MEREPEAPAPDKVPVLFGLDVGTWVWIAFLLALYMTFGIDWSTGRALSLGDAVCRAVCTEER